MRVAKAMIATALMLVAGVVNAGESAPMVLDLRTERESGGDETLPYSSLWDGGENATVTIAQKGAAIAANLTDAGELAWSVLYNGTYELTHTTYTNGVAAKVETARFVVTGKEEILDVAAGEYMKVRLEDLGYDVPTNGTAYSVKAYGLPSGLKLMSNKAVTKKVKKGKKTVTVVVKPAKCEWWIEGVPTAALDFLTNPPYLVITANGGTETFALPIDVFAQKVTELDNLALGQSLNKQFYLPGVTNGWAVSGLPAGLKYTAKLVTTKKMKGKKVVSVTTNALPYSVYGKTTKAGLFTITAKKKKGAYYETMKYRVLVTPRAVDKDIFGNDLKDITTMAYVPLNWNLESGEAVPSVPSVPFVPSAVGGKVAKVAGLPTGLAFAASTTYKDKKKKKLKQLGQTIVGTPTKPGTYVVTFTKNVKSGKKTIAKTAQILWKVVANDAKVGLGFNTSGGVIESGTVGLKYGDLLAFSATDGAKVTASGLPKGIALANLGGGNYAFTGFTAKAGTYLVTVTATLNGKTVRQRVALKVKGLPAWAKGTFNGAVYATGETPVVPENGQDDRSPCGLATITVSSVGKISGKFYEGGTNWTLSAASYTGYDPDASNCTATVTAKYSWKVKSGKKTVTKSVSRTFTLTVSPVPVVPVDPFVPIAPDGPIRGVAQMVEDGEAEATITAYQNIWGRADYKAAGQKHFYTSKKKPYKTFAYGVYTNETGSVCFVKDGDDTTGLTSLAALSLTVTPAGAVTATLTYDTGKRTTDKKTKKKVPVYYKPTCSTVAIPTSAAHAEIFKCDAYLHFAPSAANRFGGCAGRLLITELHKVRLWEGGPYWADRNVGAENPWDYGYYFWWGDTIGYKRENRQWVASDGSVSDFSFHDPNIPSYDKSISTLMSEGWITADWALAPVHDAAHVHWGGSWRMPTRQELADLCSKCDWSPARMNGVDGYIVSGRGDYVSNSIFLPCAGTAYWASLEQAGLSGCYWSSEPGDPDRSFQIDLRSPYVFENDRSYGLQVRPVQGDAE